MHAFKLQHVLITGGAAFLLAACSQPQTITSSDDTLGLDTAEQSDVILSSLGWEPGQAQIATASVKHEKQFRSAIENRDSTLVALPIYQGKSNGKNFWFVVTEASRKMWPVVWA